MVIEASIPAELDGLRADKVVASIAAVSRSIARQWCEDGAAIVDGLTVTASQSVAAGSLVQYPAPEAVAPMLADPSVPFGVLYEDEHLAVVDKPAGIVVHPGAGRQEHTLAAGLLARWPALDGVGAAGRWGLVHRLDRPTSGALLIALEPQSFVKLSAAMAAREVKRVYLAGVSGEVPAETGTIDAPIRRDPTRPVKMAVHPTGRPARTHYRAVGALTDGDQLLEVTLETGRTHQIRVHLSRIGLPVVGDRMYGWRGAGWNDRIWLHAHRLTFEHPVTGDVVTVEAPLPDELSSTLPIA